jgi:DNA repair ATPase RecN
MLNNMRGDYMTEKNILEELKKKNNELSTLEDKEDMLKRNIAELEIDKLKPRDYNSMKLAVEKIKNLEILENELNKVKEQRALLNNETWKLMPEYNKEIREKDKRIIQEEGKETKKTGRFGSLRRRFGKR